MTERALRVPPEGAGERLDHWLARALELPTSYARHLIEIGRVRSPSGRPRKGLRLAPGMELRVAAFRHPREGVSPCPELHWPVLASHAGWIAVDKPAGVPAHPVDYEESRTMVNAFLARYPRAASVGDGGLYAGLVHRLDPGTSGVLLFATDGEAWSRARTAFQQQRVLKEYVARVCGRLDLPEPVAIRLPLVSRGAHVRVAAPGEPGARLAVTQLLESTPDADAGSSRVRLRIETGLRHQIRVHLAERGHPIVGDVRYGGAPGDRIALHASRLRIGPFEAFAPLPPEL